MILSIVLGMALTTFVGYLIGFAGVKNREIRAYIQGYNDGKKKRKQERGNQYG